MSKTKKKPAQVTGAIEKRLLAGLEARVPKTLQAPIRSISLATYVIAEAALLDNLDVQAVLAWIGASDVDFMLSAEAWSERIADALLDETTDFDSLYNDLIVRALFLWPRRVPTLEDDPTAWIIYQRHAQTVEELGEVRDKLGLTPGDSVRLAYHWSQRAKELEAAEDALGALVGELPPLPTVTVEPRVFPPKELL
jgi:hypothetical protein